MKPTTRSNRLFIAMSAKVLTLLLSLAFCLTPRPATALCQTCMSAVINLGFEQMGYASALYEANLRIAELNAQIQPLLNAYSGLDSKIAETEDEDQKASYRQEKTDVASQVAPLISERESLEATIDPLNLRLAAVGGMLAAYDLNSPCAHEVQCPRCGNPVVSCICSIFTCEYCNNIITQCTCNVIPCSYCGFDSRYCGHSNPFEP